MRAMILAGVVVLSGTAAQAQVTTNLEIVDRPTLIIDEVDFDLSLEASQDVAATAGRPAGKAAVRQAVDASMYAAFNVIEETLGLEQAPQLLFDEPGNKGGIEQDGLRNNAAIRQQGGQSGWALANQLGEDNSAEIRQIDGLFGPARFSLNRAYVGQVSFNVSFGGPGYSQSAIIDQTHRALGGDLSPNNAVIQQGGIRNIDNDDPAVTRQAIGENNVAQLTQSGAGNDGLIQQGAENATSFRVQLGDTIGRNNRATLTQIGFGNAAVIAQEDDSDAIVTQYGVDNRAFVQQDGDVDASDQMSVIRQGGAFDVANNFAAVRQRAFEAWSEISQESDGNEAYVDQDEPGSYSRSLIRQQGGEGNYASVLQSASTPLESEALVSVVDQDGAGNQAYVAQRFAKASASIISQAGDGNFVRVNQ